MNNENQIPQDEAVYVISVASQLSGLHPQTLRQYDRLGIVSPNRTVGKNRRYSLLDIVKLRNVQRLVGEGINPPRSLVRRSEQTVVLYPKD